MAKSTRSSEQARSVSESLALLWGEQAGPTRGPKRSLTSQQIAAGAVRLADAEGLDAVVMSKVAAAFGVTAMAIYRYVPGKTELIDLMIESVLAEPPVLEGEPDDWRSLTRSWVRQCAAVYSAHPWLLPATAMRKQAMGPNQIAWLDAAHTALEPTGLPAATRHRVFLLAIGLVRNRAQEAADRDEAEAAEWAQLTGELLARHAERFPALTRAIADGAFADDEADFLDFGLDRILDGVQALIDRSNR